MILLDPRRGSLVLKGHIPAKHRVELCTLDSGDVSVIGNGPHGRVTVGIEVKHLGDFLQCLQDGRLAGRQMREMRKEYDYVFVLLQDRIGMGASGHLQVWLPRERDEIKKHSQPHYNRGRWVDAIFGQSSKFLWSSFWKHVISLSVRGGVRLLMGGSHQETGSVIGGWADWWSAPWNSHKSVDVFDESHLPALVESSVAARGIHAIVYGIGWNKSMLAAEHFLTLEAMCAATPKEWMAIDGIGTEIATRAYRAFRTPHMFRTITGRPGDRPGNRVKRGGM